ncbi:glycosyltransferase [Goodfellowiella coeruleoviolacea]|uniref:UDP-N-acetylglucosamine:LPS N-acetylglucosamine transferase n=1 Tax=Goodfellowiella coeruleoviolacea TaxID=334858 RepID=A0AAE3GHQ9_9PSEU|nr:glycosyltransferase [Goodfellowiella coeruleoviolacea]MCP2167610.1 UDP-N-acetylglucosamine:LPS N-acetylglucosamine transferase [Goodfellowiella coeruleoviolacea]
MQRIRIVSAGIGAGHDGAARELARRLRRRGCAVRCHDYLTLLPGRLGQLVSRGYRYQLQVAPRSYGWLLRVLGWRPAARLAAGLSALVGRRLARALGSEVDLVVSTHPAASHCLAALRRRGRLTAPFVEYLTDPSVHRMAVTRRADLTIAPNKIAAEQAARLGARRVEVAAQAIAPGFRPARAQGERRRARALFRLPHDQRLALVLCGSWAVGAVEQIARDVAASRAARPVVVCGHNEELRRRLARAGHGDVFGWVDNMPELMRACDVVVQNAGGLTAGEALASGVPVITYRCLPGHGRANAAVLDRTGLVRWVRTPSTLAHALTSAFSVGGVVDGHGSATTDPAELIQRLARSQPADRGGRGVRGRVRVGRARPPRVAR